MAPEGHEDRIRSELKDTRARLAANKTSIGKGNAHYPEALPAFKMNKEFENLLEKLGSKGKTSPRAQNRNLFMK
jgi:hypothetical protein